MKHINNPLNQDTLMNKTINMKNSSGTTIEIRQTESGIVGIENHYRYGKRIQAFSEEITMERAAAIYGIYGYKRIEEIEQN